MSKAVSEYMREIGRRGGKTGGNRWTKLSPAERHALGVELAKARLAKDPRCRDRIKGLRCKLAKDHQEPHHY